MSEKFVIKSGRSFHKRHVQSDHKFYAPPNNRKNSLVSLVKMKQRINKMKNKTDWAAMVYSAIIGESWPMFKEDFTDEDFARKGWMKAYERAF